MTGTQYIRIVDQLNRAMSSKRFDNEALAEAHKAGVTTVYRAVQQVRDERLRSGGGQLEEWTREEYDAIQRIAGEAFEANKQHPLYKFKDQDAILALKAGILAGKNIVQSEYEAAKAEKMRAEGILSPVDAEVTLPGGYMWKKVYGGAQMQLKLQHGLYVCLYLNVPSSDVPFMQLLQQKNNARHDRLLLAMNLPDCKGMPAEQVQNVAMHIVKAYADKQTKIWQDVAEVMSAKEGE